MTLPSIIASTFRSFEEAYNAIQSSQAAAGYITTKCHVSRRKGVVSRCEVRCRQSGIYRQWPKSQKKYITTTRKTDCPFYLVISRRSRVPDYVIAQRSDEHNHEAICVEEEVRRKIFARGGKKALEKADADKAAAAATAAAAAAAAEAAAANAPANIHHAGEAPMAAGGLGFPPGTTGNNFNPASLISFLESRFNSLESRFASLSSRFGYLESRFGAIETRMESLENHLNPPDDDDDEMDSL